MTKGNEQRAKIFQQAMQACHSNNPIDCVEWFADRIIELEKQNECHDLRKNWKDLPTDESDVLCYLGRDESEVGYFHQEKKQFFTIDGKEINPVAWKEIHYPQESE